MKVDTKSAKKTALMELIKHVNKKRFQDKAIDPKKAMEKAMTEKEEKDENEPLSEKVAEEESDEFGSYKKDFMKGRNKPQAKAGTMMMSKVGGKMGNLAKKAGKKGK